MAPDSTHIIYKSSHRMAIPVKEFQNWSYHPKVTEPSKCIYGLSRQIKNGPQENSACQLQTLASREPSWPLHALTKHMNEKRLWSGSQANRQSGERGDNVRHVSTKGETASGEDWFVLCNVRYRKMTLPSMTRKSIKVPWNWITTDVIR